MATSDVTIQDGLKHPYLLALVRWCVSSFWTTATVILHRLITTPIPQIKQIKASKAQKSRPASYDHLDPEPRVDCDVLHTPSEHTLDVIFVHGLYGSLGNTWRQGEWRSKYDKGLTRVALRRPHSLPTCRCIDDSIKHCTDNKSEKSDYPDTNSEVKHSSVDKSEDTHEKSEAHDLFKCHSIENNDKVTHRDKENAKCKSDRSVNRDIKRTASRSSSESDIDKGYANKEANDNVYTNMKKILPKENLLITEKFFNNTLLDDVDIGGYETQAQFVKDLFECSVNAKSDYECDKVNDEFGEVKSGDCKCELDCEAGCGCVCDDCYSPCWPRDWIRVDYPGARVISINYTSDPYLWRPLWIKESKRLRLHERAEQMTTQLLDLGVGERPIIWVGHSKGGLFIKRIYCEAYEAYVKLIKNIYKEDKSEQTNEQNNAVCRNDNEINHFIDREADKSHTANKYGDISLNDLNALNEESIDDVNCNKLIVNDLKYDNEVNTTVDNKSDDAKPRIEEGIVEIFEEGKTDENDFNGNIPDFAVREENETLSKIHEAQLLKRVSLWKRSAGFMFYSVPHRGSPLADIKTPITARSVELMEICKDCPLVLSLQDSWSVATASTQPPVRSVVETCRTLMSVLYLRIVSVDSADPGIGALTGVDVDHREICKPSSRNCLLYQELMTLMDSALNRNMAETGTI